MDEFLNEIKEMSASDLQLIVEDQRELYSDEEFQLILAELKSRGENAIAIEEAEWEQQMEEEARKEEAAETAKIIEHDACCTSTESFADAVIEKYLGTVVGTDIYLVGGIIGGGLINQEKLFGNAFEKAKERMIQKAFDRGGNAVVGMQVSFASPGGVNEMIVVVTGTAVKIKKK
jgi:uncharacterized protein YbjQ (UPF0145 family)